MTAFDKAWGIVKGDEIEMLLDKVRRNIPGYHGLTNEQLIDVIREEGITGLTTDEVAQMRDARGSGGFDGNVEALIALRQKIMEM